MRSCPTRSDADTRRPRTRRPQSPGSSRSCKRKPARPLGGGLTVRRTQRSVSSTTQWRASPWPARTARSGGQLPGSVLTPTYLHPCSQPPSRWQPWGCSSRHVPCHLVAAGAVASCEISSARLLTSSGSPAGRHTRSVPRQQPQLLRRSAATPPGRPPDPTCGLGIQESSPATAAVASRGFGRPRRSLTNSSSSSGEGTLPVNA
jgi:hypothetical protein